MKTINITLITIIAIIIVACSTSKKSTPIAASPTPAPIPSTPLVLMPVANGIYEPGNEELTALQTQYKDVTLEQLKTGHLLYTQGACINCHGAKNIYTRGVEQWKYIIEDMALRSELSVAQTDAVYKYVLAIKATQPK
jgi:mono/diheme cytochrome c family protein